MSASLFVMPAIFIAFAFMLTKGNAKYLLSGYNTMSESERAKVDLEGYLRWFKRFHIFLGLSTLAICLLSQRLLPDKTEVFMIIYVILCYAFFIVRSDGFFKSTRVAKGFGRVIAGLLVVLAVGIIYFSVISFKDSTLVLESEQMEITGIYGIKIRRDLIREVSLPDRLPAISSRTNGFNGGYYRKGNFRSRDGRSIKLFVNLNTERFLLISTNKKDIYFSSAETDMQQIYKKVLLWNAARKPKK
jgi:hypothetical protein